LKSPHRVCCFCFCVVAKHFEGFLLEEKVKRSDSILDFVYDDEC